MSVTFFLCNVVGNDSHMACSVDHHFCNGTCGETEDFRIYGYCPCVQANEDACVICSAAVNVSKTNAASILERLGIEFDCGTIDPDDLLGRAMVGNLGRDDSGARSVRTGNFTEGGIRTGYFTERLAQLADLAITAKTHGCQISWG